MASSKNARNTPTIDLSNLPPSPCAINTPPLTPAVPELDPTPTVAIQEVPNFEPQVTEGGYSYEITDINRQSDVALPESSSAIEKPSRKLRFAQFTTIPTKTHSNHTLHVPKVARSPSPLAAPLSNSESERPKSSEATRVLFPRTNLETNPKFESDSESIIKKSEDLERYLDSKTLLRPKSITPQKNRPRPTLGLTPIFNRSEKAKESNLGPIPEPLSRSDSNSGADYSSEGSESSSGPNQNRIKRRNSKRLRAACKEKENKRQRRTREAFAFLRESEKMAIEKKRILVINPNTSEQMTQGLRELVKARSGSDNIEVHFFTAAHGFASINDDKQAMQSARLVLHDLLREDNLHKWDAFLVACYSAHPLVQFIKGELQKLGLSAHVTGIFEASIVTALSILPATGTNDSSKFAIVSTGRVWEDLLSVGVNRFLGTFADTKNQRFAGVATTGLDAGDLHSMPPETVKLRMKKAVKSLDRDVSVVILGCAGMAGLDVIVREALVEKRGEREGQKVAIVDGVLSGISVLENLLKNFPLKRRDVEDEQTSDDDEDD